MRRCAVAALLACLASPALAAPDCAADRVTLIAPGGPVAYEVEIADDPMEQARGLMFRTEMARDHGMLFIFPEPKPASFWMKNTPLPLDIIFLDAAGQVLNIAEDTTPYSEAPIPSHGDALAVLEVNAGEAERHDLGPGTQAVHPAFPEAPAEFACDR